jgi:hypothetical protein
MEGSLSTLAPWDTPKDGSQLHFTFVSQFHLLDKWNKHVLPKLTKRPDLSPKYKYKTSSRQGENSRFRIYQSQICPPFNQETVPDILLAFQGVFSYFFTERFCAATLD